MRPAQSPCPFTDPGKVGRKIIPAWAMRHLAGLRLLVIKVQPFMAGEEINTVNLASYASGKCLHETERLANRFNHPSVLEGMRRICDETHLPVFRMVQVGKASFD